MTVNKLLCSSMFSLFPLPTRFLHVLQHESATPQTHHQPFTEMGNSEVHQVSSKIIRDFFSCVISCLDIISLYLKPHFCYQEAVARVASGPGDDDDDNDVDVASFCGQENVGNVTCGICMDVYPKSQPKDRRFGILPNCIHSFCEPCILTWRHMAEYSPDVVKQVSPTHETV